MKTNSFVNTPLKKQLPDMAYIFLLVIKLDLKNFMSIYQNLNQFSFNTRGASLFE